MTRRPDDAVIQFFRHHVTQFDNQVNYLVRYFNKHPAERRAFFREYEQGSGYFADTIQERYFVRAAKEYEQEALFYFYDDPSSHPYIAVVGAQEGNYDAPEQIKRLTATVGTGRLKQLWKALRVGEITYSIYYMSVYAVVYSRLKEAEAEASIERDTKLVNLQEYRRAQKQRAAAQAESEAVVAVVPTSSRPSSNPVLARNDRLLAQRQRQLNEASRRRGSSRPDAQRDERALAAESRRRRLAARRYDATDARRDETALGAESRRRRLAARRYDAPDRSRRAAPPAEEYVVPQTSAPPPRSRSERGFARRSTSVDGSLRRSDALSSTSARDLDAVLAQSILDEEQRKERELQEDLALIAEAEQRREIEDTASAIREVDEFEQRQRREMQDQLDAEFRLGKLTQCNIQGKY